MVYTFTSQAGGRITMTGEVAERILSLIDKRPGAQGVITLAEIEPALQRLNAAMAQESRERALAAAQPAARLRDEPEDEDAPRGEPVSLQQRIFPFVELLQTAARGGKDVTWGL